MSKKVVTLYVDDTSIRLLVTDGKNIIERAHSPLETGLVEDGIIVDEQEVAKRIDQLLEDRRVRTNKVIVGLSGAHSFTLVIHLPQLTDNLLAEAVMREAARVLPVPLEQVYLTWQIIPATERRIRVFLIAVPRDAADALLKTLQRAGLTPYMMDIKPLALARMVQEPNAIIVDVQPTEYDIVIIGDGVPQPIRTIPIPQEDRLSWNGKLPMITDDLTRTIEFYNSKNPENPLAPSVPVYVSGELADESETCQLLSDRLGRPVTRLSLPVSYPLGSYPSRYTVNLGLAIKRFSSRSNSASLVARMDALPSAYQPRSFSFTRVLTLVGSVIATALIIYQITMVRVNASNINTINNNLDTVNKLIEQKQLQELAEAEALSQERMSQDIFTVALQTLYNQCGEFNLGLEIVTSYLPSGVSISSISYDGDELSLEVQSFNEDSVLQYARNLRANRTFSEVSIYTMSRSADEGMTFNLILEAVE